MKSLPAPCQHTYRRPCPFCAKMESFAGLDRRDNGARFGRPGNGAGFDNGDRLAGFAGAGVSGLSGASAAHCYMPSAPNPPLI